MSSRLLSIVMVVVAAPVLAGCTAPEEVEEAASDGQDAMDNASAMMEAAYAAASAQQNASASSNGTVSSNTTSSANETQYDYGNCMRGMDMPGCPEEVAERYFDERAANAPPPDKPLPNIVLLLDPQGANEEGAFTIDAGTMQLLVEIMLNDTGSGAYATLGDPVMEDIRIELVGPDATETITLAGGTMNAGATEVAPMSAVTRGTISMPSAGAWTLRVVGQGINAQVDVRLVERFYM